MTATNSKRIIWAFVMIVGLTFALGVAPSQALAAADDGGGEPKPASAEPSSAAVAEGADVQPASAAPAQEPAATLGAQAVAQPAQEPANGQVLQAQADFAKPDEGQPKVEHHDPYKHASKCDVNQEYGTNTVYLHCDWSEEVPLMGSRVCEFHEWPLIILNRTDDYYDGTPKAANWYVQTMRDYPSGKLHEGFPSDIAEWDGQFTYYGVNGTSYKASQQAPIAAGTYRVQAIIKIPHLESVTDDGTFTLVKEFSILSTAYDVTFDSNAPANASTKGDMRGAMPTMHFESAVESRQLAPNQFVLPGYRFDSWNTKADGTGARYANGAIVKGLSVAGQTKTLYAQWTPKEYTLTFQSGDAGSQTHSQTAQFDQTGTLDLVSTFGWNIPLNTELHGWRMAALGLLYDDGEEFCNLCDIRADGEVIGRTLNAEWAQTGKIIVSITRDGALQSGMASCFSLMKKSDGTTYVMPTIEVSTGVYVFNPGSMDTEPVSPQLPDGDYELRFNPPAEKGFGPCSIDIMYGGTYAVSTVFDYYTVTLERDPAYAAVHSVEMVGYEPDASGRYTAIVRDGGALTIKTTVGSGYHFDGYSATGVAPGWDPAKAEQQISVRGQAGIMAHVEANVYTVRFDANARTPVMGKMANQDMVYNEPQGLFANQFSQAGWVFKGWNTKPDGTGDAYADKQSVQNLTAENGGTVVLYAQWEEVPVVTGTLTFDLGGGTLDGQTGSITVRAKAGDVIEMPAAPTREGYTFKYWRGSEYYPGDKYKVEGDHKFTAVWEKNAEPEPDPGTKGSPSYPAASSGASELPKTADGIHPFALALLACAIAAICLFALSRRKRDHAYTGKHVKPSRLLRK